MRALTEELCLSSDKTRNKRSKYETHLLKALKSLNELERSALFLRFWVPCSIEEVSRHMHISWPQADQLIERTLEKLRDYFRAKKLLR